MKKTLILFVSLALGGLSVQAQDASKKETAGNKQIVETSCGQCNFGLTGGGCDLAVKVDGKAYYVDGSSIHDHGDAHAKDGMCMKVRKAEVEGKVVDGRFKAESFKLMAEKEGKK